jgi:hypothetical protein
MTRFALPVSSPVLHSLDQGTRLVIPSPVPAPLLHSLCHDTRLATKSSVLTFARRI